MRGPARLIAGPIITRIFWIDAFGRVRVPHPSFFEEWDSTVGFLWEPCPVRVNSYRTLVPESTLQIG